MNFAGLLYHVDSSLCIRIFPAGLNNKIDWTSTTFSEKYFAFYNFKESQCKENYIEFSNAEELNIHPLRLKETVRYKCRIESEDDSDNFSPHFKNESNKLLKIERDEKNSFTFQFINYLGKTSILFNDGQKECSFDFEIVPDKINYEEDYVKLTEAIAEECSALLLDYTSPTSLNFQQDSSKESNILEQFIFLRQFCFSDNLESLFASIKRNPDRILVKEEELKPFGTGIPSQKFFSNPFTHSRGWIKTADGNYLPSEVATIHKYDSYDTSANRFIKFALITFSEICTKVLEKVFIDKNGIEYYSEASKILNQIDDILNDSFFDDINELTIMPVNNQVLEKREGYSQIFNAFSMVDLALKLYWKGKDDVYSGESKNTALLYEYWLFFELRKIIHELSGKDKTKNAVEPYTQFINDTNGLTISLQQGNSSLQSFIFENEKLTINLYYNRTFSPSQFNGSVYWGSYSRPFRPDYTLAIFSSKYKKEIEAIKDGNVSYIHFDAKYRIQDLTQFINSDKKQISEEVLEKTEEQISDKENEEIVQEKNDEIINTYKRGDLLKMHTYNDAIRKTVGSYVLYPGNNNNSGQNEVSSSYDEILPGVGAFAIRPGNEDAGHNEIKKFIKKIIDFKSNPAGRLARKNYFDNMILSSASEKTAVKPLQNEELCMLGFLRNDYFEWLKNNHLIPTNETDNNFTKLEDGIYFYYHAIRDGYVYPLHKDISKATKFCASTTDFGTETDISKYKILPFLADIISTQLVSADDLGRKLKEMNNGNGYVPNNEFKAQFYYLVKLKNLQNLKISGDMISQKDSGNMAISPYSPKIIELQD
ncbi:DUF2357 domain-containing protein [Treponema sp. C6A8]|uniref:DUF2357 domain-containing protein n=1 Tax=Treponema sp. C6A8 TaxID=1410609 RepID=UPI000483E173|nr:DUF2357 domain-containing protein [Treponema sp. C6A8]